MMTEKYSVPVDHVSDTAWLVAAFRAKASERQNPRIHDPLARKLLDQRLEDLFAKFPDQDVGEWMMTVRTTAIDRLIAHALHEGIDTVVNLACGLDTRPYRLTLPADVTWIEVDYPHVIEHKKARLAHEKPTCRLERRAIDLSSEEQRRALWTDLEKHGREILVITEGLLYYLRPEDVDGLANELRQHPAVKHWIMDVVTRSFFDWSEKHWNNKPTEAKGVEFRFLPLDLGMYFEPRGWATDEFVSFEEESARLSLTIPEALRPLDASEDPIEGSGVLILRKLDI